MADHETFFDVANVRTEARRLFAPELLLDMWGRDWAIIDGPWGFTYTGESVSATTHPTGAYFGENISVEFPPAWDLDSTWNTLEVAVSVRMTASLNVSGTSFQIQMEDSTGTYVSTTANVSTTSPSTKTLVLVFPQTAVPNGRQEMRFYATPLTSDTNNVTISRTIHPPDCHIWVRLT